MKRTKTKSMRESENTALIKSKKRVHDYGEVFTPEWLVSDMCDMLPEDMFELDKTFLEPSCGTGNFLAHILQRKLEHASTCNDVLRALGSLYGVDLQQDNVEQCRERLVRCCRCWKGWDDMHDITAQAIVCRNIICGNFLEMDVENLW